MSQKKSGAGSVVPQLAPFVLGLTLMREESPPEAQPVASDMTTMIPCVDEFTLRGVENEPWPLLKADDGISTT